MNSSIVTLAGLFLVYATTIAMGLSYVSSYNSLIMMFDYVVSCLDTRGETLTRDEIIALTRDYRARIDPDLLLNGFFPVWALIQVLIGCK